jgi:hypothetical protein
MRGFKQSAWEFGRMYLTDLEIKDVLKDMAIEGPNPDHPFLSQIGRYSRVRSIFVSRTSSGSRAGDGESGDV